MKDAHMKAIRFHRMGGPEVLHIEEIELLPPGPNEVRIKVSAFALNRADLLLMVGQHYTAASFPSRIGSEASGIVDAVGENVSGFNVGDRVSTIPFHTAIHGVQGEYATVPAQYLAPWPEGLSATEACSVWMQYLTAYFPFNEITQIGEGDWVLIAAASSSAGQGAMQIARAQGAKVVATTRTVKKQNLLQELGAHQVIVTEEEPDIATRILELTEGKGVKLAYDPIGGDFTSQYAEAMAWHGVIILYGVLAGTSTDIPVVPMVRRAAVLHPYSMFNHVSEPDQLKRGIHFISEKMKQGLLRPRIDHVFSFSDAIEAYHYMESNQQSGKIVVSLAK